MNIFYITFLLLLSVPSTTFGIFLSKFTLYNKTDRPLYFAAYHQQEFPKFKAKQVDDPISIEPGKSVEIEKPSMKLLYTRVGLLSFNKQLLEQSLTHREFVNLESFSIGVTAGETFIIKSSDGQPYVDNSFNKATDSMKKILTKTLRKNQNLINLYKLDSAMKFVIKKKHLYRREKNVLKKLSKKLLDP
ncbi:hypothetical protein JKY79_01415 [Candidatus Babeliales bacterium]|nr:hypothetical protein [Candidatus Babeliales bacterium]